jgi:hypothetical protein
MTVGHVRGWGPLVIGKNGVHLLLASRTHLPALCLADRVLQRISAVRSFSPCAYKRAPSENLAQSPHAFSSHDSSAAMPNPHRVSHASSSHDSAAAMPNPLRFSSPILSLCLLSTLARAAVAATPEMGGDAGERATTLTSGRRRPGVRRWWPGARRRLGVRRRRPGAGAASRLEAAAVWRGGGPSRRQDMRENDGAGPA